MAFTLTGSAPNNIIVQTGAQQSQAVTAVNLTATTDTGTITGASSWVTTLVEGTAIAITSSAGAYKGTLCVKSVSTSVLTFYRLYDEDKSGELTPAIVVGDIIQVYENGEDVVSGVAKLSTISGVVVQVNGTGKARQETYAVGDYQFQINGYFHLRHLDTLEFGNTNSNAVSWLNGGTGTLCVGSYKTINGVSIFSTGTAIKMARTGLVYHQGGAVAKIEWFGGKFNLQTSGITSGNIPYLSTYSKDNCVLDSQSSETQFRYESASHDWKVRGLTTMGYAGVNILAVMPVFKRWKSRGSENFAIGLSSYAPLNTWMPVVSPDFDGSNVGDLRGIGSRWYDVINPKNKHQYSWFGGAALARSRQDISLVIQNPSGTPVKAKVYIKDSYNSGNRLIANQINANPDFTPDAVYSGEATTGTFTASLVMMYVYTVTSLKEDFRFPMTTLSSGQVTGIVPAYIASYGYVSQLFSFAPISDSTFSTATRMVVDTNITQTNATTVGAYTTAETTAKAYDIDRLYRYTNFAGDITSPISRSGNKLIVTGRTVVIDPLASAVYVDNGTVITLKATTYTGDIEASQVTLLNGAMIVGEVTGNVIQDTPSNLSGVSITGTLTYNTNTNTTITITNTTINTVANSGTGIVTISRDNTSSITTYTDAEINFLDSNITFAGVDNITFYPTSGDANAGTNAGATVTTSPYNFKYGSVISGVTMSGTLNIRYTIGGKVTIGTLTVALGSNSFVLTDNELLASISTNMALEVTSQTIKTKTEKLLTKNQFIALK